MTTPTPSMLIESIRTELRLLDEGVIRPEVALSWIQLYVKDFKYQKEQMTQLNDYNIDPYQISDQFMCDPGETNRIEQVVYNIAQWAEDRNITAQGGATSYTQIPKLIEEVNEFRDATTEEEAKLEFGDILVVCIQIARLRGLDMVECLDLAYQKIKDRKGRLENGVFIKDAS